MALSLFPNEQRLGLLTDLYELTMAAGYHVQGLAGQRATFELWVRRLPTSRNYLVTAGLEQAVHYLQELRFAPEQVAFLKNHPAFAQVPNDWFECLRSLRFEGDLWAMPEGTVTFAGEPLLRVTAPLMVAQMVETYLLTTLTVQTLVASKAARVTAAAQGRPVVDFGSRRAHGPQAGLLAARAAFIGGCTATSNTEAARLLGIPAGGTQAHAWVLAFGDETEAFRRFGQVFSQPTFLIDTFDTLQGLKNALACEIPFQAVRLDSGDLEMLSKEVRARLDALGRQKVKIVASGDLQEYKIRDLLAAGAPIDVFGVGTEMVCSRDEPSLNAVYKLVEQETPQGVRGRFKLAPGKETYPMAKQVYRQITPEGRFLGDLVTAATESSPGIPLLEPVLHGGRLIKTLPSLEESQRYRKEQCSRLPAPLLALEPCSLYSVQVSETLQKARRGGSGR